MYDQACSQGVRHTLKKQKVPKGKKKYCSQVWRLKKMCIFNVILSKNGPCFGLKGPFSLENVHFLEKKVHFWVKGPLLGKRSTFWQNLHPTKKKILAMGLCMIISTSTKIIPYWKFHHFWQIYENVELRPRGEKPCSTGRRSCQVSQDFFF